MQTEPCPTEFKKRVRVFDVVADLVVDNPSRYNEPGKAKAIAPISILDDPRPCYIATYLSSEMFSPCPIA